MPTICLIYILGNFLKFHFGDFTKIDDYISILNYKTNNDYKSNVKFSIFSKIEFSIMIYISDIIYKL